MLDVFGLKKEETHDPEPSPAPNRASAKLWAAALVIDAVFVIVFGGAVASRVYQHWKTPQPPTVAKRPAPPKPPKAQEPAKPAEPPKPPEPPKQAEAPKPVEPAKPLARPSLLSEPPRRQAPQPQATAAPSSAQKAQPIEFKLKAPNAKKVHLVGAFIVRGGRKEMAKGEGGVWSLTLYLTPNTYRYYFAVDGKRTPDPENPGSSITVKPQ